MSDLIRIGYWYSNREPHLPKAQDAVGEWSIPDLKPVVINYLKSQPVVKHYDGWSNCRFCHRTNGATCLSDGVYIWPEGYAHYLEKHNVVPPQEFIVHVCF